VLEALVGVGVDDVDCEVGLGVVESGVEVGGWLVELAGSEVVAAGVEDGDDTGAVEEVAAAAELSDEELAIDEDAADVATAVAGVVPPVPEIGTEFDA